MKELSPSLPLVTRLHVMVGTASSSKPRAGGSRSSMPVSGDIPTALLHDPTNSPVLPTGCTWQSVSPANAVTPRAAGQRPDKGAFYREALGALGRSVQGWPYA